MRMPYRKFLAVTPLTLWAIVSAPSVAEAQQQRQPGTSTGGTQGASGIGSAATGGGTVDSLGGTTAGATVQGVTGRQAGTPTGQGIQRPEFRAFGETQNQNTSGFIGRGATETFVGQQLPGQQQPGRGGLGTPFGGTQFGGTQFGGLGAAQGTTSRGTGITATRTRAERLRPRHRVAFSFAPVGSAAVSGNLQAQMRPLQAQGRIRGARFSLAEDGTLTLRGTAATVDDRELAAAVARLEPGVRRVDNQIVVPQAVSAPSPNRP